jgi:hypothetical protein
MTTEILIPLRARCKRRALTLHVNPSSETCTCSSHKIERVDFVKLAALSGACECGKNAREARPGGRRRSRVGATHLPGRSHLRRCAAAALGTRRSQRRCARRTLARRARTPKTSPSQFVCAVTCSRSSGTIGRNRAAPPPPRVSTLRLEPHRRRRALRSLSTNCALDGGRRSWR